MTPHPFSLYTRQVLAHRLGTGDPGYACAPVRAQALAPVVRTAARAGGLILLGLGSGEALARLEAALPPETDITVCELYPGHIGPERAAALLGDPARVRLLADTSPMALCCLLLMAGTWPAAACALNPEVADPKARQAFRNLARLLAAYTPLDLPALDVGRARILTRPAPPGGPPFAAVSSSPRPRLCLGAILHPDEPDLEGFFRSLPAWADNMVVVWDALSPPEHLPASPCETLHLAHPLENDFAAQRNRMLAACRGDWMLSLDADERLSPDLEALLPALLADGECGAFAFTRLGLRPDGVRMGYGLWPDVQLRLIRLKPGLRYVRPVHERIDGLCGPTGLVLGPAILHLSDLTKDLAALARKHALFDRAAGAQGVHRQNAVFPVLPQTFFTDLRPRPLTGKFAPGVNLGGLSS